MHAAGRERPAAVVAMIVLGDGSTSAESSHVIILYLLLKHRKTAEQWRIAVSTPPPGTAHAVVYNTTQTIRRGRGVSLRTTTQWRHALQRYRHASLWHIMCKCDVIHYKTGSTLRLATPQEEDRVTATCTRIGAKIRSAVPECIYWFLNSAISLSSASY